MKIEKIHLVWFSATATTKRIVKCIAEQFSAESVVEYNITKSTLVDDIYIDSNELLIVGMPVYAGRIPAVAANSLQKFKGNKTYGIIVCVYGNRDYDDALLELKDTVQTNGFVVVSAAAFIAQHSIFPTVGADRPDEKDMSEIQIFGKKSAELILSLDNEPNLLDIETKGNHPYKTPGKIPLHPKGNRDCNACGTCVSMCPTNSINKAIPRKTDGKTCISCARCIAVCPQHARHFTGFIYKFAGRKFTKANAKRKEPQTMYIREVN